VSIVTIDGTTVRVLTVNAGPRGPAGATVASGVTYDPTVSGLTATTVQAAIDELRALISD